MIQRTHLLKISGLIWLAVSFLLLLMGFKFLLASVNSCVGVFLPQLVKTLANEKGAIFSVSFFSAALGLLKGSFVMKRSAKRTIARIEALQPPFSLHQLYSPGYIALVAVMMSLGVLMKVLSCPLDVRGSVDIAVGVALFRGAFFFLEPQLQSRSCDS